MDKTKFLNKITSVLLKLFIITALFFPIITSMMPDPEKEGAFPEFILANLFAVCFMVLYIISSFLNKRWNQHYRAIGITLFVVLLGYNFFYYINFSRINWIWEALNITISFLFFIILLVFQNQDLFKKYNLIRFITCSIVCTNLFGILVYYKGFLAMHMYNFKLAFIPRDPNFYETRYNWIYSYKCQYALMLLLFVGFIVTYRREFKSKITYLFSLVVLFWALIISHTYTSLVGAVLIVLCDGVDILFTNRRNIKYMFLGVFPASICILLLYNFMKQERNIVTLGGRPAIWKASVEKILENPEGIGNRFSKDLIVVNEQLGWKVTNCHNIFLNEMLRFSIPAGFCFSFFILFILLYALVKKLSFLRVGIAVAFLIAVSMDYSILPSELSMVMFMFYCIYFLSLDK